MAALEMGIRAWWFLSCGCFSHLTHCFSMGSSAGHSPFRVVLPPVSPLLNMFSQRHHRLLWLVEGLGVGLLVVKLVGSGFDQHRAVPDHLLHRSPQQPAPNPAHYARCRCLAIFTRTFISVMLLVWFVWVLFFFFPN